MWRYEKRLQYPVNIKTPNPKIAQYIMSQYGGPDGEIGASMRYLSQRYTMPYKMQKGLLTDIGTEELAHMEMIAAIVQQLTRNLTPAQIESSGFGPYYIDHTTAIWPQAAGGVPVQCVRVPVARAIRSRILYRGYGSRAESPHDLRQYPASLQGLSGSMRADPIPARAGDRTFSAVW